MGQSLQEHVAELKEQYPNMKIETRRDRDGFAIVKASFNKEYKYKLDMYFDPEEAEENYKRSVELLL